MMKNLIRVVSLISLTIGISGCITPQAYVDPSYKKATYESVNRLASPIPVKVEVQFQRNGKALPAVDKELRSNVERALRASGVYAPTQDANATIKVVANNIADLAAARSKGFKTGLTFGGSGSMVDDNYEFMCSYVDGSGTKRELQYQHAIHTAIGHIKERPQGIAPVKLADAFGRVVEDVTLNFVKDLQDNSLALH